MRKNRVILIAFGILFFFTIHFVTTLSAQETEIITFSIKDIKVTGNTLLPDCEIEALVSSSIGVNKTVADVEKIRDQLEGLYHTNGYPTVLVNIPEQKVEEGVIRLQVVESKIGEVKVTGNRFFSRRQILKLMPSFQSCRIILVSKVQEEINSINNIPDIEASPVLMPGKIPGTTDAELKIKDHLPLHGQAEVSNRSIHNTKELRASVSLRYDNLWQKFHSLSLYYQISPQDMKEADVFVGSYTMPSPLQEKDKLSLYGIVSNGKTAIDDSSKMIGKGNILGARYLVSLPSYVRYNQNLSFGMDYKDTTEIMDYGRSNVAQGGSFSDANQIADVDPNQSADNQSLQADAREEDEEQPIRLPSLSVAYGASVQDSHGITQFSSSLNHGLGRLTTGRRRFEQKRKNAFGNYLYITAAADRTQNLSKGLVLFVTVDGQLASQALPSNEQYSAGGMENVRGYKQSEALGDNALHGTLEIRSPRLAIKFFSLAPYLFYDFAQLWVKHPLEGEDSSITLQGIGLGLRGEIQRCHLEFNLDLGWALESTDKTKSGHNRIHFKTSYVF